MAWDPAVVIRLDAGVPCVRADSKVVLPPLPRTSSELPAFLERLVRQYRTEPRHEVGEAPRFLGGLIGFASYEWAASQEGPDSERLAGFPDLWFGLYDRALVASSDSVPKLVVAESIRGANAGAIRRSLAASLESAQELRDRPAPTPRFLSSWSRAGFESTVHEVRQRIRRGDVYQVDLALQLRANGIDPYSLFEGLWDRNPSPFAGLLEADGVAIVSASPERLLRVSPCPDGSRIAETRPIAGTRPRSWGVQDERNERSLRRSPKEGAEHTMLVDLGRNDLGRVCSLGTVEVDEWLTVERYSHVMHLESNVRGSLPDPVGVPELFRALMPGGSVTGTPKIRASEIIAELEPVPRGPYTGSLGYIGLDGRIDFNLLIRSAFFGPVRSSAFVYAGAGIVQDSRPEREWAEVRSKAAVLLEAASGGRDRGFGWQPPRRYASWRPPRPPHRHRGTDVLLIDNYDSFTYNLAQYLSMLGARVRVVQNDAASLASLRTRAPTHVVLSPGPGRPEESGVTVPAVRAFEGVPLLGVCLGHEAIIEAYGGTIGRSRRPMHGKTSTIECVRTPPGGGLLENLGSSFRAARYHSLVARTVPPVLRVTARTLEGEVMAVQHRRLPTYGVQFHPESLRTEQGMAILDRFLSERGVLE